MKFSTRLSLNFRETRLPNGVALLGIQLIVLIALDIFWFIESFGLTLIAPMLVGVTDFGRAF